MPQKTLISVTKHQQKTQSGSSFLQALAQFSKTRLLILYNPVSPGKKANDHINLISDGPYRPPYMAVIVTLAVYRFP